MTASLTLGPVENSITFNIILVDNCPSATVTLSAIPNKVYELRDTTLVSLNFGSNRNEAVCGSAFFSGT